MSWVEILDLSHSALPRSTAAIDDSGVLRLINRRGGINNGAGMQLGEDELRKLWGAGGGFAKKSRRAARAEVLEEEEGDLI